MWSDSGMTWCSTTSETKSDGCAAEGALVLLRYSCKGLSSLSHFSKGYRDTGLQTKTGSAGRMWQGHLGFVTKTQTLYTLMENVMAAAARGGKFWQM